MARYYTSPTYQIEVSHDELNKYRIIKGKNKYEVEEKARIQRLQWNEMWERKVRQENIRREKADKVKLQEMNLAIAQEKTSVINNNNQILTDLLINGLSISTPYNWEEQKNFDTYDVPIPVAPLYVECPFEPTYHDCKYKFKKGILDRFFPKKYQEKLDANHVAFTQDYSEWEATKQNIIEQNDYLTIEYNQQVESWQRSAQKHKESCDLHNADIDKMELAFLSKDTDVFLHVISHVIENSCCDIHYIKAFELEYNVASKTLIIDYTLPNTEIISSTKEVKYVKSTDSFTKTKQSKAFMNNLYDTILYQITLLIIYNVFNNDSANMLDSVVFNGFVTSIDKSTGNETTACLLSCHANKPDFLQINLSQVDPKACFKSLKGVGSSKLHSLTPIAPLININKSDSRFVDSYNVIDDLDTENIAAMHWQDFENLVRDLFELEFSSNGGEVKITQASRDGGVDAIAFDPDPIRGGKIVIQAKRYTNTVGVSAVRDLYGTIMNEGATKGILVSTADFGPDAYNFAKDKPITLLNGGNLLHLLEAHGKKAKIDLKEAKVLLTKN